MRRWRWLLAVVLLVLVVALSIGVCLPLARLAFTRTHVLVEVAIGETPQRRVAQYFDAIRRGSRDGALAVWRASATEAALQRRDAVTDELLAMGSTVRYSIEGTEWWRNCCEPGLIDDPAGAGVARFHIAVTGAGSEGVRRYTVDVTTVGTYWGDAGGDPVRHWLLRDVYQADDQPLAFPWPQPTATPAAPQALADIGRDPSRWPAYASADWPLTLHYPPGWTVLEVVYGRQDYGPVIRVSAGDRVLEIVRRGNLPPNRSSVGGSASIGPMGALIYYEGGGEGPRRVLVVPVGAGETIAFASINLRDTDEDAEYLRLFLTVLSSVVFE